jgi:hypothetical protein
MDGPRVGLKCISTSTGQLPLPGYLYLRQRPADRTDFSTRCRVLHPRRDDHVDQSAEVLDASFGAGIVSGCLFNDWMRGNEI